MLGGPDTNDSWLDRNVFDDRMRALWAGFNIVQCELGGASTGSFGCDEEQKNCICPTGTRPKCTISGNKLTEWRQMRDGFSRFYASIGGSDWFDSDYLTRDPSLADVQLARDYARKLVRFYVNLPALCPGYRATIPLDTIVQAEVGTTADQIAQHNMQKTAEDPAWVRGAKYGAWTIGIIGVIWLGSTLKSAFKD